MQATIQNEFLTLTVDTHGAEAVSLKNAAGEELLWQADPAVWKRHAPILFPWTGKLVGGSFTHRGKSYPGGQHGFARDLEHTLLSAEGDTLRLELRSTPELKAERFPFDFVLTSTFRLEGKTLHHTLTVQNPPTRRRSCASASATTRPSASRLTAATPPRITSSALTSRKALSSWTAAPMACSTAKATTSGRTRRPSR